MISGNNHNASIQIWLQVNIDIWNAHILYPKEINRQMNLLRLRYLTEYIWKVVQASPARRTMLINMMIDGSLLGNNRLKMNTMFNNCPSLATRADVLSPMDVLQEKNGLS